MRQSLIMYELLFFTYGVHINKNILNCLTSFLLFFFFFLMWLCHTYFLYLTLYNAFCLFSCCLFFFCGIFNSFIWISFKNFLLIFQVSVVRVQNRRKRKNLLHEVCFGNLFVSFLFLCDEKIFWNLYLAENFNKYKYSHCL